MLSPKVAQSIVDRTMAVLGVQVNIMDAEAIIIASGNLDRVGKFHQGAAKVLKAGKKLSISYNEASRMEDVRPGTTLPITFRGKIIGAVGMAGDPKDVENFGELLKLTAELMLEQASVKEEIYLEQRAKEGLLNDLITGHWREYEWHFLHRAELLNYNLKKVHLVMTVEIFAEDDGVQWDEQDRAISYQKLKARLEERLSGAELFGGQLICCFINRELAVLYQMPGKINGDVSECVKLVAEKTRELIDQNRVGNIMLGVGGLAPDWKDICTAYVNAKNALQINKIYHKDKEICFYDHYKTEHMLHFIPEAVRTDYWKQILGPIVSVGKDNSAQWLNTMQTYFDNEMNAVQTAECLFLHRNTLLFRLNKIKEITGLQPQKFQDAMQLKLALLLMKMDEGDGHRSKEE